MQLKLKMVSDSLVGMTLKNRKLYTPRTSPAYNHSWTNFTEQQITIYGKNKTAQEGILQQRNHHTRS